MYWSLSHAQYELKRCDNAFEADQNALALAPQIIYLTPPLDFAPRGFFRRLSWCSNPE
jgi:hypothetical protein